MQAVAAPASIREQALTVIVDRIGPPISLGKKLTEAGDAMLVADVLSDLESRFDIHLDDFWQTCDLDELARLVETRVQDKARRQLVTGEDELLVLDKVVDLAAERARRARAPLFPPPTIRDERHARRRASRRHELAVIARLAVVAVAATVVGMLCYFAPWGAALVWRAFA